MKPIYFVLAYLSATVVSQAQQPLGSSGNAARPPSGGSTSSGTSSGNAARPPSGDSASSAGTSSGNAARPPAGDSASSAGASSGNAARPPSGGAAAAGGSTDSGSGGSTGNTAQPPSGGSGTASGDNSARPPVDGSGSTPGGGSAARPPVDGSGGSSGGNSARPPVEDGTTSTGGGPQASYACPGDNGKRYTTGGITYELKCGQGTTANRIQNQPCFSQKQCADLCSADPRCQSCDWNENGNQCATFSEYIPTIDYAGINTWFPIEKRPDPPPPYCPVNTPIPGMQDMVANITSDPKCPGSDGYTYATNTGFYFKITCFWHRSGPAVLLSTQAASFGACMDICSSTPNCKSVKFKSRPTASQSECLLFQMGEELPPTICNSGEHDFSVLIDPPTVPAPPEVLQKRCATDCPAADGKIHIADNGEAFQISCCKRHALNPLQKVYAASMSACLDECSKVSPCSAVDFQINTASCYLLDRHAPPTVNATAFASAFSLGCGGACKACSSCSSDTQ